ncbi:MAG: DUF4093 domain-containing protein [Clostridia bacterium]|nr:DUF4093 domain-containing protein [Clostridia bacterium]
MISVKETIIVEGEHDKKKLLSILDADILVTDGFRIFKDKEMQALLRRIAKEKGIVILTDSDKAGFIIRNFIKSVAQNEKILNAFIPEIKGKEKRKEKPGKEGILGVEGMEKDILLDALVKSGATVSGEKRERKEKITKLDLYKAGLYGKENSRQKREEFLLKHNLPKKISANMLITVINLLLDKEELF